MDEIARIIHKNDKMDKTTNFWMNMCVNLDEHLSNNPYVASSS